jgi:hypothetical protein
MTPRTVWLTMSVTDSALLAHDAAHGGTDHRDQGLAVAVEEEADEGGEAHLDHAGAEHHAARQQPVPRRLEHALGQFQHLLAAGDQLAQVDVDLVADQRDVADPGRRQQLAVLRALRICSKAVATLSARL